MGIYDRDYYRDDEPRGLFGGDQLVVVNLVLITCGVFLVQFFGGERTDDWLTDHFAATINTLWQPWHWYRFVTYGFLHGSLMHILFNMLPLWMFGTDVEGIYGRRPFLWLYLTALTASGVGWALVGYGAGGVQAGPTPIIGASGAVTAVLLIYCLHFPHRKILLMFFPVPAWLAAAIFIGGDFMNALNARPAAPGEPQVAYVAHLAGAAYGFLFFKTQWSFYRLAPSRSAWSSFRRRMTGTQLRVHQPDRPPPRADLNMQSRVDDILEKISRSGQDSLTPEERTILENASRHYQQQRRK